MQRQCDSDHIVPKSADARCDRFSLLTDFVYANFGATASDSHLKSVNFMGLPAIPIDRSASLGLGSTLRATIWTFAGGYTVPEGDWSNLDLFVGLRGLSMNVRTNYSLEISITGPRGNGHSFGGIGYVSGIGNIWNGIAGLRGRVRIADFGLFIPYCVDIGGGSQPTWQIATGLGYQKDSSALSATFRYLSSEQGRGSIVQHLGLAGQC